MENDHKLLFLIHVATFNSVWIDIAFNLIVLMVMDIN
jgi:hypothetical protein